MNFFKSNFFFIIISFLILAYITKSCLSSPSVNYGTSGPSGGTQAYLTSDGNIDLAEGLDPKIVPALIEKLYDKALKEKVPNDQVTKRVMKDLQAELQEISTIDLNSDGNTDPILVTPEGTKEHITYSIKVPDPDKVKYYPTGKNQESNANDWQDIADNKSIEIMSVMVIPQMQGDQIKSLSIDAEPNRHMYHNSHGYYHSSYSSGLLTGYLVSRMFMPPLWYGHGYYYRSYPGYYGGGYYGRSVSSVRTTRTSRTSGLSKSSKTSTAPKTASGKSARSASSKSGKASAGASKFKSTAISKRAASKASNRASGFSRGRSTSGSSRSGGGSRGWGK